MNFSIVTPSFRNSDWLKLCIASVADQSGVTLEHIVQDACSDDGTQDWLPADSRVKAFIEKDHGMYDAINRGFKRATGDIVAYLNCDEQYLPGALKSVHDYFIAHPEVEAVFAHTIVVDPQGRYLCHRKSLLPRRHHLWVRFSNLTCAIFIRRQSLEKHGLYFDTQWRAHGDIYWVMEMVNRGVRMAVLDFYTSLFHETGENLSLQPHGIRERKIKTERTPAWIKRFWPVFILLHRLRMLKSGAFFQQPFTFTAYLPGQPNKRVEQPVAKPTALWPGRRG